MAIAEIPTEYLPATTEDYDAFVTACDAPDGWNICYESSDGKIKVWDQPSDKSAVNVVRLLAIFSDVDHETLYDTLHDPYYRKIWDDKMIEGFLIEQINETNDVGYYSAKMPFPLSNRDFVNERSWRVKPNEEYIIMNHSVIHSKEPERKGFVRANSIKTGYLVRPQTDGGCVIVYQTQTDPKGAIPTWLVNQVTKNFAPNIVGNLEKAAKGYNEWKGKNSPDKKPWRGATKS